MTVAPTAPPLLQRLKRWLPITLLDRYLIRQFLVHVAFMLLLFALIVIVVDLAEKMGKILEQKIGPAQLISEYYANFLPWFLIKLAPLTVFLSVIVFTARLSQNSEIVAILSSGTSFYRLLVPYLATAGLLTSVSYTVDAYIVPPATRDYLAFDARYFKGAGAQQAKNIHRKIDQQGERQTFLYIRTYAQITREAYEITLEEFEQQRLVRKLRAGSMSWIDTSGRWRLVNLNERYYLPEGERLSYRSMIDTVLKIAPEDIYRFENAAESLTQPELERYIRLERDRGSDFIRQLELKRDERVAFAFAALILTTIGVAVSSRRRRGGIGVQIGLGLALSFVYLLLLNISTVALGDSAPTWVAVWLPNAAFTVLAVVLIRAAPK